MRSSRPRGDRSVVAGLAFALMLVPLTAAAQDRGQPEWIEDFGIVAANALIGGATAAVSAWLGDRDVSDALMGGALGGGVGFVGKRLAAEDFGGAGLTGRQIGAVGANIVANAGRGLGWLEEIWLPVGPVWIQTRRAPGWRARIDLPEVAVVAWAVSRSELQFDAGASLRNGALFFRAPDHRIILNGKNIAGFAGTGVVLVGQSPLSEGRVRAHEMTHVIQQDFLLHAWSRSMETAGWRFLTDRPVPIDLGVARLLMVGPLEAMTEGEAELMEGR